MANPKQELLKPKEHFMLFEQSQDLLARAEELGEILEGGEERSFLFSTEGIEHGQGVFDGGAFFSAVLTEDHSYSNDITSHPVEAGSDISDNVRQEPITISVDAIYVPEPEALVAGELTVIVLEEDRLAKEAKIQDIFNKLIEYRKTSELLTITTSLRFYENMVIENLTVPRDSTTGHSLLFSILFKQIRFVDSRLLEVKTRVTRAFPPPPPTHKIGTAISNFTFKAFNILDDYTRNTRWVKAPPSRKPKAKALLPPASSRFSVSIP